MGRREKQFSDTLLLYLYLCPQPSSSSFPTPILPHPNSPSSLSHLGSLAFVLPYSPAPILPRWLCSGPVPEAGELSRKVNTSPLQRAALRAGLLRICNSARSRLTSLLRVSLCFVYMVHRANSE